MLSGNTQELLSQGVQVSLKRREPYDPILEASIGYAGAAAVAIMDEVAFVNERQDERMEGIEEGALSLVPRVMSVSGVQPAVSNGAPEEKCKGR